MPWNDIIKGAFLTLIHYCGKINNNCPGCIFFEKDKGCLFSSGELPYTWELPVKEAHDQ